MKCRKNLLFLTICTVLLMFMTQAACATETNIALNPSGSGYPSPLESDHGWGGGSNKWDIVDGLRDYPEWYHGLAFTGGTQSWDGESAGVRQATINFGGNYTFDKVIIWHHTYIHIPAQVSLQYWDGSTWKSINFQRDLNLTYQPSAGYADTLTFEPVTGSKVRYSFDNSKNNINGTQIEHGWIYEFEVYGYVDNNSAPVANAGPDQVVEQANLSGTSVTLDGSGSTDDRKISPLTYNWTWNGGSATGVKPMISLPLGTTTVTLNVSDGQFSSTDTVNVTVKGMISKKPIQWGFSPQEPVCGDSLNINGSVSPGEKINVLVTFNKTVPVSEGRFEYILENVTIPEGSDNLFTVEAMGANNLNVRVKMVLWVTKSSGASEGTATVSQSNVPAGTYTIKIDGDTGENVSEINLKITASQGIQADSNGNFSYFYNTTAVPVGNFEVKIGDITKEITLRPKEIDQPEVVLPVANFSSNISEGFAPLSVQFNDSSENATSLSWDFENDGVIDSNESNPVHVFTVPGNYTVNLTAINANGTDSKSATIIVTEQPAVLPVANFRSNVTTGNIPLSVQFNDLSENVTEWNWSFGDGAGSVEQNPTHTYSTAGNYTVTLTANNSEGSNTVTKYSYITVVKTEDAIIEGHAPLSVQFTDLSESATSWKWNFGDGNTSTEQNPTHTYSKPGQYTVTLTANNMAGSTVITKNSYIIVTNSIEAPVADFSVSTTLGKAPLDISFMDKSAGSPNSWKWSFGDGKASTKQNPTHTYDKPGQYTVTLTVNNVAGSSVVTKYNYIIVSNSLKAPVADFSASTIEA